MFQKLMATGDSVSAFFLRISLGIVMLAHGLQQTFGFFDGIGLNRKMDYYTGTFHIPTIISFLGIMTISIGAVLLIAGLWGRITAFFIGIFLLTAMTLVHIHNGFFMNWEGVKSGEGFEYHILGFGIVIAIMIYGSGRFSIDRFIMQKKIRKAENRPADM